MLKLVQRVKFLRYFMSTLDAIRMVANENKRSPFEIRVLNAAHPIVLRGATTDIHCFEKVFIHHEYRLPFELEPRLIVDAGANIGMATVYLANRYPKAKVVAIEPEPTNFRNLKWNCRFLPNVVPLQGALWWSSGMVNLMDTTDGAWAYSVTDRTTKDAIGTVEAFSILDILRIAQADHIDLLKLDIEGAERDLFLNHPERWLDRVSIIAVELHDRLKPGCSHALYSTLIAHKFHQEVRGENVFIKLLSIPSQI